jgi:hypothetical protein
MRWYAKGIKSTNRGKAEGGYMRALDCDCGQHLEAADAQKLFDEFQKHVNRDHLEMRLSAEQVRKIVTEKAYDKRDILAGIDIPPRAAAYMGAGGMLPSSATPEPRQKRQHGVQADEKQEGKKGLVDKVKDKLSGQQEKTSSNKARDV